MSWVIRHAAILSLRLRPQLSGLDGQGTHGDASEWPVTWCCRVTRAAWVGGARRFCEARGRLRCNGACGRARSHLFWTAARGRHRLSGLPAAGGLTPLEEPAHAARFNRCPNQSGSTAGRPVRRTCGCSPSRCYRPAGTTRAAGDAGYGSSAMPRTGRPALQVVGLLVAATLLTGCASGTQAGGGGQEVRSTSGSLKGVCPEMVVVQTSWFSQVENFVSYQLLGKGYTVDTARKCVTGPLVSQGLDTGVDIEIRAAPPRGRRPGRPSPRRPPHCRHAHRAGRPCPRRPGDPRPLRHTRYTALHPRRLCRSAGRRLSNWRGSLEVAPDQQEQENAGSTFTTIEEAPAVAHRRH